MLALTVMLSMKLIGFLMLAVRHEAISQILGLLVLENGIFLGSQILVPGMPLLIEIVILFDLLIVVACFGVLVQYLLDPCRHAPAASTSSGWWAEMAGALLLAIVHRAARPRIVLILLTRAAAHLRSAQSGRQRHRLRWPRCRCRSLSAGGPHASIGATTSSSTGLGAWVILCTAIVYLLASIYAVGYMRLLDEDDAPAAASMRCLPASR